MDGQYPEHERLSAISDESQAIGTFVDWALDECHLVLPSGSVRSMLASYYEIDEDLIEEEKLQMLQAMRDAQYASDMLDFFNMKEGAER